MKYLPRTLSNQQPKIKKESINEKHQSFHSISLTVIVGMDEQI
jgi:hypothetical protein